MSIFVFTVTVETERESGKFMGRDEIEEQILDALEGADPQSVEGGADGDSVYSIVAWDIEAMPPPKRKKAS